MRFISIFATLFVLIGTGLSADEAKLNPNQAFQRLKEGNQRFAAGKTDCNKSLLNELEASKEKQTPYAAILCCSDSRVPPELVFDESLGKLFVIRVAGNVTTDVTIGSIEYAVEELKVPIVVVLGHDHCGVIKAALSGIDHLPPFIYDLLNEVSRPAKEVKAKNLKDFDAEVRMCVIRNVEVQMEELLAKSEVLKKAVQKKQAQLKGAVFHFNDAEVQWCPCSLETAQ